MNVIPMLVLVILAIIFLGITLRQPLQQIRRLRQAARGPIGMLPASGLIGVTGQATSEELRSPLTNTPCVLWQVIVERHRTRGRWTTIFESKSMQPIILDDGTGRVQVLPMTVELLLSNDLHQTRGLMSRINPEIETKLEELGPPTRDFLGQFGPQLRVSERYIMVGEQLSALGYVEHSDGQLVLRTLPDTPLFLTDQDLGEVLRGLYRRVASTVAVMMLIVIGFSCCLLLQLLEPR